MKADQFITLANEKITEYDAPLSNIYKLYATALSDAANAIEYEIGEYNWEKEVAPLLVKGIKSYFRKGKEMADHPVEGVEEGEYHEVVAIGNDNQIQWNEKPDRIKQTKKRMEKTVQNEDLKPKRKRGRPRKGQEKPKDGDYVDEETKTNSKTKARAKSRTPSVTNHSSSCICLVSSDHSSVML